MLRTLSGIEIKLGGIKEHFLKTVSDLEIHYDVAMTRLLEQLR